MNMIEKDEADLIVLDSGQGYFAGRQYNMMPIMAEDYKKLNGMYIQNKLSTALTSIHTEF